MANREIREIAGKAVFVPGNDVDTDRITPARFLKVVTFEELGDCIFYDQRFGADGTPLSHPLNHPQHKGARILIVNRNFGCGSSREHSPQALRRNGFDGFIGESFAEIFFSNCTTLGMVCVTVPNETVQELARLSEAEPELEVVIDIDARVIRAGGKAFECQLSDSVREAFMSGQWDPFEQLAENAKDVRSVYDSLPYVSWTS